MNYTDLVQEIAKLQQISRNIDAQRGGRHRDIDKCGLSFWYINKDEKIKPGRHHSFPEAQIRFDAYNGYYGSSSVSNDMSEPLADWVLAALNCCKKPIIDKAVELIDKEIHKLAKQAKEEAGEIQSLAEDTLGQQDGK